MKTIPGIFLLSALAMLSACDMSVYTTSRGSGETLYLVNKFTGAVSEVRSDAVIPLRTVTSETDKIKFSVQSIPNQPIKISGESKYVDGELLLKIRISPSLPESSSGHMDQWRTWLDSTREVKTASLVFKFLDADSFVIDSRKILFADMQKTVDSDEKAIGLSYEERIPMSPTAFASIKDWTLAWSGYWGFWLPREPKSN